MMLLLELYGRFFLTGLFSIGGGLATIPFLQDLGQTTGWFTQAELADMIAVSESTPGAIGINMATYVGYTTGGIPGGIAATLGLITPGLLIILIIAGFLQKFRESSLVDDAFYGLRAASLGLIACAGLSLASVSLLHHENWQPGLPLTQLFNLPCILLAVLIFLLLRRLPRIHPIAFIALSAAVGIVLHLGGA